MKSSGGKGRKAAVKQPPLKQAGKGGPKQGGKRRQPRGRDAVIVGLGFILVGGLLAFLVAPSVAGDRAAARSALVVDAAAFESVASGEDVAVNGTLVENLAIEGEAVLLVREQLQRVRNGDNSRWEWEHLERTIPGLVIQIPGGIARTTGEVGTLNLLGERHESLESAVEGGLSDTTPYLGQRVAAGSVRSFSLYNGDEVTVLGTKTTDGRLAPRIIYGGDPAGLDAELARGTNVFRYVGLGFMGAGFIGILIGLSMLLRRKF
jgi:hypothetical protein